MAESISGNRKPRTLEVTHKIMSSIPSKNTRPELALRKELWREKLRYRVNYKKLPGKPDIALTKYRVAVFCDGDFWHGHNWAVRGLGSLDDELANYSDYWKRKSFGILSATRRIIRRLRRLAGQWSESGKAR